MYVKVHLRVAVKGEKWRHVTVKIRKFFVNTHHTKDIHFRFLEREHVAGGGSVCRCERRETDRKRESMSVVVWYGGKLES